MGELLFLDSAYDEDSAMKLLYEVVSSPSLVLGGPRAGGNEWLWQLTDRGSFQLISLFAPVNNAVKCIYLSFKYSIFIQKI